MWFTGCFGLFGLVLTVWFSEFVFLRFVVVGRSGFLLGCICLRFWLLVCLGLWLSLAGFGFACLLLQVTVLVVDVLLCCCVVCCLMIRLCFLYSVLHFVSLWCFCWVGLCCFGVCWLLACWVAYLLFG